MRTLLLHIGTMKTGSTSIQACLMSSTQELRKHNIYYFPTMNHNNFSFSPLFKAAPESNYDWKKNYGTENVIQKTQQLKKQWIDLWGTFDEGTAVVSSETLSFYSFEDVERLYKFVAPLFDEVRVIIYFRDPGKYITSMLQQDIKNGYTPSDKTFLEYYQGRVVSIQYKEQLSRWIKIFGPKQVTVRPFQRKSFYQGSLEKDFFYHGCGVQFDQSQLIVSHRNESLNLESAVFLYELNRKYPTIKHGVLNKERGMANRPLPSWIFAEFEGTKIDIPLFYDSKRYQAMVEQVDYVNSFLSEKDQISCSLLRQKTVDGSVIRDEIQVESPGMDYFVEVINGYNKLVASKIKRINALQNRLDELKGNKREKGKIRRTIGWRKIGCAPRKAFCWIQYLLFKNQVSFSSDYYQDTYEDVDFKEITAMKHYFLYGAIEGRIPREGMKSGNKKINPLVHERLLQLIKRSSQETQPPQKAWRLEWSEHLTGDLTLDEMKALSENRQPASLLLPDLTTYIFWKQSGKELAHETVMSLKKEYLELIRQTHFNKENSRIKLVAERCIGRKISEENVVDYSDRVSSILHYCLSRWDENGSDDLREDSNLTADIYRVLYPVALMESIHLEALFGAEEHQEMRASLDGGFLEKDEILAESFFVEWMNCYHRAIEMVGVNCGN